MNAPEEIHNVSMGYFSIARYYGGCKFNGHDYVYDATRDVLIRGDIFKARHKPKRKPRTKPDSGQMSFDET